MVVLAMLFVHVLANVLQHSYVSTSNSEFFLCGWTVVKFLTFSDKHHQILYFHFRMHMLGLVLYSLQTLISKLTVPMLVFSVVW